MIPGVNSATPDDPAVLAMLERNMPALQAFIRLRMGNALAARESSSDVLQSVCRELIASRGRVHFDDEAAFRAWLYTAALRKILQKVRHHTALRRSPEREDVLAQELAVSYSTCITPSRDASAREQVERFELAFARLSEVHREVIALTKIAGLTHQQVGTRIGKTPEACRTLLRRALIQLSALMQVET